MRESPIDLKLLNLGFDSTGRLLTSFELSNRTADVVYIDGISLVAPEPTASGSTVVLTSIDMSNGQSVVLENGNPWSGDFRWDIDASKRAKVMGKVLLVIKIRDHAPQACMLDFSSENPITRAHGKKPSLLGWIKKIFDN